MKRKIEMNYFYYSMFVATILSLITLVITFLAPSLTTRLIYLFFYYLFFNFTLLLTLAFVVNHKPIILHYRIKKWSFLAFTIFYSIFYLASSYSFFITGQTIKIQSIYFAYQISPLMTIAMLILGLLLVVTTITVLLSKNVIFKKVKVKSLLWTKIIFFICLFLLFSSIFYFSPLFEIKNPIVKMYNKGNVILIHPEEMGSEVLLDVRTEMEKPNVVFVLLESVSEEKMSYYGYNRKTTPNIDEIAEKGIVFMNAYTTATHSDYAQPTYLSSRYVLENEYRTFYKENPNRTFVWDVFANNGYTTGYISSQNDLWANMDSYLDYASLDFYWYSLTDGETDYGSGLAQKDYDHKTMNVALNWLNNTFTHCASYENETINGTIYFNKSNCLVYEFDKEEPFFLYMNLQGTHNPLTYHENYSSYKPDSPGILGKDNYDNRYDNSLLYVDAQLGRLFEYLENQGVMNNTVVILSSDHGHDTQNRHNIDGHAKSVYDDELRVPLIFYFPDLSHMEIEERVSHVDVLPTLVDILGLSQDNYFDGEPMTKDDRLIFYMQNHKYMVGMIKGDIKTTIDLNRALVEIYDLNEDPNETHELLRAGNYDNEILEVLLWHNCQLNYFSVRNKPVSMKEYCENF